MYPRALTLSSVLEKVWTFAIILADLWMTCQLNNLRHSRFKIFFISKQLFHPKMELILIRGLQEFINYLGSFFLLRLLLPPSHPHPSHLPNEVCFLFCFCFVFVFVFFWFLKINIEKPGACKMRNMWRTRWTNAWTPKQTHTHTTLTHTSLLYVHRVSSSRSLGILLNTQMLCLNKSSTEMIEFAKFLF